MAKIYAGLLAGLGALPVSPPEAGQGVNSFVHVHRQVITLAAQPTTDTQVVARLPGGHVFLRGEITSSVSLATSTISFGPAATPAKYRALAVHTAVDTPTPFGLASACDDPPLVADEEVLMTVGTAALPGAGILVINFYTSKP